LLIPWNRPAGTNSAPLAIAAARALFEELAAL
jgi:hypothetical protein